MAKQSSTEILSADSGDSGTSISSSVASGEQDRIEGKKFGTFNGVFRPTILTILGVMMYLREGWLVGNAGLAGAVIIILISYIITGTAALAISSITSNIRLGAGGVFSIVSQSLGLEVGGSIGIPFYFAQALSSAMYIYGFMEGWLYIFPDHPPLLVVTCVFILIFILSYISTGFAFKVQFVIMAGVIIALSSMFMGVENHPVIHKPALWGGFEQADFWKLFAVFFPASTGIMVGASMSGNLKNPRKSIPVGTLAAWVVSLVAYISIAVWYSYIAQPGELMTNLTVSVDKSFWGPAVLIGILSSCFTAGLSSFVAAPRVLQSLGAHKILAFSSFFAGIKNGEPRNAIAFTGLLVLITLIIGDLNTIAQVLTVIFLLTYFSINCVLLIEKKLGLISFRPSFHIPLWIPVLGTFSCISAILIISPFLGLIALLTAVSIYVFLNRSNLRYSVETVRSGLFESIAHWAAKKVASEEVKETKRSWKPDLLVPVEKSTRIEGVFRLLTALTYPQGSIQIVGFVKDNNFAPTDGLKQIVDEMREEGLFATSAIINASDYLTSLETSVAVKRGSFFQPNIIFSSIEDQTEKELQGVVKIARKEKMGIIFYGPHPEKGFGRRRKINIWIRDQSPKWHLSFDMSNIDLSLLLGYKLMQNWEVTIRVMTCVSDRKNIKTAESYLKDLMDLARIQTNIEILVEQGNFMDSLKQAPRADLSIIGLPDIINAEFLQKVVSYSKSTCLFVISSGRESILA